VVSQLPARSTLKDVAAIAGVSIKTASRALAGEYGVNLETMATVVEAARKLDYRPNRLAQQLRSGVNSKAMALLIGDLSNPFYSVIASGVESVLRPQGFDLFIASTGEEEDSEKHIIENFIGRAVDGLIVIPAGGDHFYLERERVRGTPLIFLDRPPTNVLADSIVLDEHKAASMAMANLFKAGHSRIAVLADSAKVWTAKKRIEGVEASYTAEKIDFDQSLVFSETTSAALAEKITLSLLQRTDNKAPTAILALNNQITIGAISAFQKAGKWLGLVGFDDFDLAEVLGITVIRHSPFAMGKRGAELALERLAKPNSAPQSLVMDAELVDRGSAVARKN